MMRILLIDDEPDVRDSLSDFLVQLGHKVLCAKDGLIGLNEFHKEPFDVIIADIRMPRINGLELLYKLKKTEMSPVNVIIITGHGNIDTAIEALRLGAFDYIRKPINLKELVLTLERIEEYQTLRDNYSRLRTEFNEHVEIKTSICRVEADWLWNAYLKEIGLEEFIIFSDAMRTVMNTAKKYAVDRETSVLIEGETGTGKELVARFIHYYGQKTECSPFISINCGAIQHELWEAEFFGHEKGAFTGATPTGQIGKIEAGNDGTIFLDEIGEMPIFLQVKLLRVLEEKKIYRVGGIKEIPIDVRFIAATNKVLSNEIKKGRFRLDLYHRLNMGMIKIPPLRERINDILPMSEYFAKKEFKRRGRYFPGFNQSAESALVSFQWPGNVRQLKNVMSRLALMELFDVINANDLSFLEDTSYAIDPTASNKYDESSEIDFTTMTVNLPDNGFDIDELNHQIIKKALIKNNGNISNTARYLGITRRVLQGRIKKMRD